MGVLDTRTHTISHQVLIYTQWKDIHEKCDFELKKMCHIFYKTYVLRQLLGEIHVTVT